MTCIIGFTKNGSVWIGGDRAASTAYGIDSRVDAKVFRVGEFLIGTCGSVRTHNILQYSLSPPKPREGQNMMNYMVNDFIGCLRDAYKNAGILKIVSGVECDDKSYFLLGYRGELFIIHSDFQVGRVIHPYDAIGSGEDIAKGAMSVLSRMDLSPEDMITRSLEAAEFHTPFVRAPFDIIKL